MAMNADILAAAMKAGRDAVLAGYVDRPDYTEAEAAAYRLAMAKADAQAIIDHIHTYGEVASLTVSNTPMDGAAHTHSPASTTAATGKIS
ncbi:hypothetical protein M0R72_07820 [Candidatus Pacearchaeota archaeon]|jgi:hypothetical protein|nr:hypothetical protein [Candidatus Pacearchaeota archaeon]